MFQPFVGMAADKCGEQGRIIIAGACATVWLTFYLNFYRIKHVKFLRFIRRISWSWVECATSYVIVLGAVAKVVPAEHAAKAFGLTTAAGSFGMFAVDPGAQYMLNEFDWQSAMQVFSVLCCLMISFALLASNRSQQPQQVEDTQTLKEALSGSVFGTKSWLVDSCGLLRVWFPRDVHCDALTKLLSRQKLTGE
ncbi:MFS transporter [Vibrio lentus]|nr:MFS transporter [Vibrio lentus]